MAETSRTTPPPARTIAYCSWHKDYDDTCRLVRHHDAGSGFGPTGLFACTPCRDLHGLTPLADRP